MTNEDYARLSIDNVVEAAAAGALRALEARNIAAADFTRDNGFYVDFQVRCGAWPEPKTRPGPLGPIVEESGSS